MPWLFALSSILSSILLLIIVISWIPSPEIEGVPPEAQSAPLVPGLLGILSFVIAGRQLYLRGQSKK